MLPANWHDDGAKLTCPNGHCFIHGFRVEILRLLANGEDPAALEALENEQHVPQVELHANSGSGTRQLVAGKGLLIWTQEKGVKWSASGPEIAWCYNALASLQGQLKSANTEIATLKAQHTPPVAGAIGESITALQAQIASLNMVKSDAEELLKIAQPMTSGVDVALVTAQNVVNKLSGK